MPRQRPRRRRLPRRGHFAMRTRHAERQVGHMNSGEPGGAHHASRVGNAGRRRGRTLGICGRGAQFAVHSVSATRRKCGAAIDATIHVPRITPPSPGHLCLVVAAGALARGGGVGGESGRGQPGDKSQTRRGKNASTRSEAQLRRRSQGGGDKGIAANRWRSSIDSATARSRRWFCHAFSSDSIALGT